MMLSGEVDLMATSTYYGIWKNVEECVDTVLTGNVPCKTVSAVGILSLFGD
jgi:hypothetical protein